MGYNRELIAMPKIIRTVIVQTCACGRKYFYKRKSCYPCAKAAQTKQRKLDERAAEKFANMHGKRAAHKILEHGRTQYANSYRYRTFAETQIKTLWDTP